jgi:hypothetical protein
MTFYKCGHKEDTVIMNTTLLSLAAYFTWKDTTGFEGDRSLCFNCWIKEENKKVGK